MGDFPTPRALEAAEIPGIVGRFRHAAEPAHAAVFDGVEIHAGALRAYRWTLVTAARTFPVITVAGRR